VNVPSRSCRKPQLQAARIYSRHFLCRLYCTVSSWLLRQRERCDFCTSAIILSLHQSCEYWFHSLEHHGCVGIFLHGVSVGGLHLHYKFVASIHSGIGCVWSVFESALRGLLNFLHTWDASRYANSLRWIPSGAGEPSLMWPIALRIL
jgi:hypothetical protein